jgi:hypothetical protein
MLYGGRSRPPSVWAYGLGTSINWDVIYRDDVSREHYECSWWPLHLDGIYLGTLLYRFYLESEMQSFHADEVGARIRFSDGTETRVGRDGSELLVTRGDVTIADGFERFIPRGDSIYAFSRDGSRRSWVLPERFRRRTVDVRTLGDSPATRRMETGDLKDLELLPREPAKVTLVR